MAKDRDHPRRRLILLPPDQKAREHTDPKPSAAAAPCPRYHPPRHPDDDDNWDRPLGEFGSIGLRSAADFMRDCAQLLDDLTGDSVGGTHPERTEAVEVRVGTLRFVAESLREMGARCGETYHAEVLGHRAESTEAKDSP